MEKQHSSERLGTPLHLVRCLGELCYFYALEQYRAFADMMDDALDVDFGDGDD